MDFKVGKERICCVDDTGRIVAEINFPQKDDNTFVIERTFVDDSLRGQGVAAKLVDLAVEEIEARGGKAEASCSYAAKKLAQRKKST